MVLFSAPILVMDRSSSAIFPPRLPHNASLVDAFVSCACCMRGQVPD